MLTCCYFSGNIFISFNTDVDECHNSGDEGFDENETPGPRKRMPLYKIGMLVLNFTSTVSIYLIGDTVYM